MLLVCGLSQLFRHLDCDYHFFELCEPLWHRVPYCNQKERGLRLSNSLKSSSLLPFISSIPTLNNMFPFTAFKSLKASCLMFFI